MESSTILVHQPPPTISEPSLSFDSITERSAAIMQNGTTYADSESDLSEPAAPLAAETSPPSVEVNGDDEKHLNHEESSSQSDEPEPEGDGDYEMDMSIQADGAKSDQHNSSSDESVRPAKRKAQQPLDEEDYIRKNPEIYGLRRSGRARAVPNMAESSDDQDSASDVVPRPRKRLRQTSRRSSKQATPLVDTPSDSDASSDAYGGRRAKLTKKQRRRLLQSAESLTPAHAEVRFSTRRAARVSNYNEDDDDDMFEEDDPDTMTPNYWVTGQEDNSPAIDMILNHRLRADVTTPSHSKEDYEFLIKWQQKAYYHATWETLESLAGVKSLRRLENYIKKTLQEDIRIRNDPNVAPEDKEKWILDREQYLDALEEHKNVERVIGARDGEDGTEYYVKWKGLSYDNATWEASSLVSEIAQHEIDRYINRSHQDFKSNTSESNPSTRSAFQPMREQPSYIQNGTLRDFQMTGVNFLAYNWVKGKNVVLADEMGLGKTVQTVAFLSWLRHNRGQQGPFLVVVPLSTMPAWADTFDMWAPDINYVIYNGNQNSRNIIRDYELLPDGNVRHPRFHVLLTTYEYVLHDASFLNQIKWQFMAVDEAHRLKNRDSQLYDRLREFKAPARLLITGTPVQNNLGELSALFDFLNPGVVNIDENMDLTTEEASAKIAQLTEDIKPYMLRRTKQKVEKDLPPKTEKIIRVELSDIQLEYYKNILTKNYAALNQGAKGQKQSLLNIMMELKKASNHPFMFPSAEERLVPEGARRDEVLRALVTSSGKMMLLDQLLTKLKRDGHRVLIFSQMVKMLDILGDYMEYRGHAYQRLDGTIAAAPRRIAIDHFNAPDSNDFCFLLSTRAGGLGINLMTADTVIIFDSDWNPQADLQAMARAHRIGQQKPVSVYRLVSKETVEEEILERARNKLMLEFLTIQRGVTDEKAQARRNAMVGEPGSSSEISRILKKRGQKMFEQTDNQKKLEELDLDAVLNSAEDYKVEQPDGTEADGGEEFLRTFDFVDVKVDELSWDDIIPKEQLEEIKAEEQRKAEEKYLAEVIEQNKPRVRNHQVEDREARKARRQEQRQKEIESDSDSEESLKADPARPLSEREYRYLIKGHLRYGSIDDRQEEFLTEARLRGRDLGVVKAAMQEIWDKSLELYKEEQERMAELERTANRPITKKDRKAILFELHGVKRINAETILERPGEMRLLQEVTSKNPDFKSFRVPEATKNAGYTCSWGAREDGMLCVGIARHGYGAWEKIRDDPDLDLKDKFFLEEHRVDKKAEREKGSDKNVKSPGAVHLVRRADYLISVLKSKYVDDPAAKRAVENHHRNNKKHGAEKSTGTESPAPGSHRKVNRDSEKPRHRTSQAHRDSSERNGTPRSDARHGHGKRDSESRDHKDHKDRKHRDDHGQARHGKHASDHKRSSNHANASDHKRSTNNTNGTAPEVDPLMVMLFKPVKEKLKKMKASTKSAIPDPGERAAELRNLLRDIGNFINQQLAELDDNHEAVEKRFWEYAKLYWPNRGISSEEVQNIYIKILVADEDKAQEERKKKEREQKGLKAEPAAQGSPKDDSHKS
ncbi:Chromodomain helicase hrp3 [Exophiala dermatitidis]|uniref:Chromodomain-helicase-DNA-binding protein 1 n=1 Tax=Exophiala dermatitidis (strain ATCC 34100 / CBS 525.76 / NIH/UT8656) TaxID=858893 RepID=H6BX04_EXODN|nr:chromodomain-helicase-DNA-binding protein 1 [Exophiala dermatitidis NIH/UT8656]EHY56160.1 chromodomain-helicase-DNA-binding protein 1 [Exophiala dermatitidis NIH/UT8656]